MLQMYNIPLFSIRITKHVYYWFEYRPPIISYFILCKWIIKENKQFSPGLYHNIFSYRSFQLLIYAPFKDIICAPQLNCSSEIIYWNLYTFSNVDTQLTKLQSTNMVIRIQECTKHSISIEPYTYTLLYLRLFYTIKTF